MEGTIHIDQALTAISVGYRNSGFVADKVFPIVGVDKQSDKYYVGGKNAFRSKDDLRQPGAEAAVSRLEVTNDNFFCDGHALKDFVPREHKANADPALDLMIETTENLTDQVQLRREVNLVTQLTTDMTGASVVDLTAIKWSADANNPIKKIRTENQSLGKRVGVMGNVLVLSQPTFTSIRQNSTVTGLLTGLTGVPGAMITAEHLAALLELDEVIVAKSLKDTANEGQTPALDWVWGDTALLFYRPPSPGLRTLALGYTFRWRKALAELGGSGNGGQAVLRYFVSERNSDAIEVHDYYALKTVDKNAGVLFTNAN